MEEDLLTDSLKIKTNTSEISILNTESGLVSNRYIEKKNQIADANTSNKTYLKEEKGKLKDLKQQGKTIEK